MEQYKEESAQFGTMVRKYGAEALFLGDDFPLPSGSNVRWSQNRSIRFSRRTMTSWMHISILVCISMAPIQNLTH
jgi:hypothetical protein